MGGVCSAGAMKKSSQDSELKEKKLKDVRTVRSLGKRKKKASYYSKSPQNFGSGELRSSSSTPSNFGDAKKSSFLGKAGFAGLEKAVEVLDTIGSGMTNLNSGGFTSGLTAKGNKISVLAFEVANTITKAAILFQSLSAENVWLIKEEISRSEAVQHLVSTDMKVLLSIAAADKREELHAFSREVVRFGDLCKDPQWHSLDRFFTKLDSENVAQKPSREEAELKMRELTTLAHCTAELYHELNTLDRFQHDYQQKLEEVKSLNLPRKGESTMMFQTELKHQKKLVWSLKKKSLWSKKLEEVIEKLVDIVFFIHHEISEAYGPIGETKAHEESDNGSERLGVAGLALHYANMINQIDNIASRPTCLPPNIRDSLYHGLPASVKTALRSSLRRRGEREELAVPEIKAEMEKILQWLVPMAANTARMHQGFGWVGEWANTSHEFSGTTAAHGTVIRLQTLYHADKAKTDAHLLDLVTMLHRLIRAAKQRDYGYKPLLLQPPAMKRLLSPDDGRNTLIRAELSEEERNLLERVSNGRLAPGISKSQEFFRSQWREKEARVSSRSMGRLSCLDRSQTGDYLGLTDQLETPLLELHL
ncbi:hypothetical protein Nepgr_005112 [Nepenthes gracilis]|uniref:Uncharacterized protein n=1 Tax=Nepenthes gracilis TaxID=150966 RepID=A0AAD3S2K2_NEPGR|nr:hypothetical protein Nepgr_005112 [Nepenthes gracilis]